MPVERVGTAAKTYLAAIGATAIYVSVDKGIPIGVGVARDLDKALHHLRKIITPTATFGWVAWGMNYARLAQIAQVPDLIYVKGVDGIKVARQIGDLAVLIERIAKEHGVPLTPHARVLERAHVYAGYLDEALEQMQRNSTFTAFNQAYKMHRQDLTKKGEVAQPFWAVMQELRAVIIRALIAEPKHRLMPASVIIEIRQHFPWFTKPSLLPKRTKRKP